MIMSKWSQYLSLQIVEFATRTMQKGIHLIRREQQ